MWASMLKSSVWLTTSKETKLVWVTMLLMKDADGIVRSGVPGIAHEAVLTIPEVEKALKELSGPDKYTQTQAHEGRRIKRVSEGWFILNHEKYRTSADIQAKWRRQKANQRAKEKNEPMEAGVQESLDDLSAANPKQTSKRKTKEELADIQEAWSAKKAAESVEHAKIAEGLREATT
jgi:hypothetical protein